MTELKNIVVCTLFEGHYHFGVAALANSLYKKGFRGSIYAGYKGDLPYWAVKASANAGLNWKGAVTLDAAEGLQIHFLPLTTDYHLTNYKPDFMLELWDGVAAGASGMFYFDPDITISARWGLFERWIEGGVALCEDINSPLPQFHPKRVAWRTFYQKIGMTLNFKDPVYVNGGFVGLMKKDLGFLTTWKEVQEGMALSIGGLNRSAFTTGSQLAEESQGAFSPFNKTDQDALNASVEAWAGNASLVNQAAMGFKSGSTVMHHALGQPKPWMANSLKRSVSGRAPRSVDHEYWKYADGPVQAYPGGTIKRKKLAMSVAILLGRFYSQP